jgi:hypothetical protein
MADEPTSPQTKAEVLERMREGRAAWDALIGQVPDAVITEPLLPGSWSVKDLIGHVAAYEKWTAAQIQAANEGRAPTNMELYGVEELPADSESWDLDRQNAAIYAHYRDMPLADVRAIARRAFDDLLAALENVPEADLSRQDAQAWLGGTTLLDLIPGQSYGHYGQHVDDLRAVTGESAI